MLIPRCELKQNIHDTMPSKSKRKLIDRHTRYYQGDLLVKGRRHNSKINQVGQNIGFDYTVDAVCFADDQHILMDA